MKAVIFAGGVGSRLWPLSRKNSPKQFEKIVGDKSTLQLAVDRLLPMCDISDIYISTGRKYVDLVKKQFPTLPEDNILLEPQMRDVGPAIGLVSAILEKIDPNEPVAWLWSDQIMKKEDIFRDALKVAEKVVKENDGDGVSVYEFKGFEYRPGADIAQKYFTDGHHAWNLGYFVTTPAFLWSLFKKFAPELYQKLETIQKTYKTEQFLDTLNEIYPTIDKIHFDNAILEKIDKSDGNVLSVDLGWSDIGAWESLKEALSESEEDNVTQGKVLLKDSRDSLVFNYNDQLVVGIDLDQMLVINTGDVLLVCPKNSVPKIKKVVEEMVGTEYEELT